MNVAVKEVTDEQIKTILEKGYNLFDNNLNVVLSILKEGGNSNEQQSNN